VMCQITLLTVLRLLRVAEGRDDERAES
jgi:hypothetical protein